MFSLSPLSLALPPMEAIDAARLPAERKVSFFGFHSTPHHCQPVKSTKAGQFQLLGGTTTDLPSESTATAYKGPPRMSGKGEAGRK